MDNARGKGTEADRESASRAEAAFQQGSLLLKADRPRRIDPHIDYFGEAARAGRAPRLEFERAG